MCARVRSLMDSSQLPRELVPRWLGNFEVNVNAAPTDTLPMIVGGDDGYTVKLARFGITRKEKDGKSKPPLINARTDSIKRGIHGKDFTERRCIIPLSGFYEFMEEEDGKKPFYFFRADKQPMLMAGIWSMSEYKGDIGPAFAIITDEPNRLVEKFHNRMPLGLRDAAARTWLESPDPLSEDVALPVDAYAVRPMNPAMNKWQIKDLAIIEALPSRTGELF